MLPQPIMAAYRAVRAQYRSLRKRSIFEKIYRDNLWGDAESRSGTGPGLAATEKIRSGLLDAIQRLNVRSVRCPCGDYYWLSTVDLSRNLTWYQGFDIVPQLIEQNKSRYATDKISFQATDLIKQVPPRSDLILCRHLLIHLSFDDGLRVLRNFKRSGSRYLLITNQPDAPSNEQIIFTSSYRPVNLRLPPFNFPQPLCSIDDSQGDQDQSEAALFELQTIVI
jgi:hypothetical protein